MKHLNSIDAIRAFAVSIVVFWHFVPAYDKASLLGSLKYFLPTGNLAVTLFFVLSGYLITNILLNDKDRSSRKAVVALHFLIRRVLRIFPIYFLLLIILVLMGYPFAEGELPYLFTFTSNFYTYEVRSWTNMMHTWSLAVEEQFYLLWPWLILFLPNRYHLLLFLSCICISLLTAWLLVCGDYCDDAWYVLTISNLDAFGIGGIYAMLNRNKTGKEWLERAIRYIFVFALIAFCSLNTLAFLSIPSKFVFLQRFNNALLSIGIIHIIMNIRSGFFKDHMIDNRFIKLTGRISYGIYLYHIPVQHYIKAYLVPYFQSYALDPGLPAWLIFHVTLVWVIAYLSYQYIEKPTLRYKDRFSVAAA